MMPVIVPYVSVYGTPLNDPIDAWPITVNVLTRDCMPGVGDAVGTGDAVDTTTGVDVALLAEHAATASDNAHRPIVDSATARRWNKLIWIPSARVK
jgi:hypothetical protein